MAGTASKRHAGSGLIVRDAALTRLAHARARRATIAQRSCGVGHARIARVAVAYEYRE